MTTTSMNYPTAESFGLGSEWKYWQQWHGGLSHPPYDEGFKRVVDFGQCLMAFRRIKDLKLTDEEVFATHYEGCPHLLEIEVAEMAGRIWGGLK